MTLARRLGPVLLATAAVAFLGGCAANKSVPVATGKPHGNGKGIYKVGTPYQIDGVWYYPAEDWNYEETGIASWYGEAFHAKETANGEVFDLNSMTAAHRTLPLPTVVRVTNLENGRTVDLRVNDRGPFARGRVLDVSRRAAQLLGFEGQGTAKVRVKILVPESIEVQAAARRGGGEPTQVASAAAAPPPQAAPTAKVLAEALPPPPGAKGTASSSLAIARAAGPPPVSATQQLAVAVEPAPLPEKVRVVPVKPTQIFIQAGAYAVAENATRVKHRLEPLGRVQMTGTKVSGASIYRVRLGPIASVEEADRLLARVVDSGLGEARIVVD